MLKCFQRQKQTKGVISIETIIQQIALGLASTITKKALEGGMTDIDQLSSDVLNDCKNAARKILEAIAQEVNLQIRNSKAERKKAGLSLKEKDRPRQLYTELGLLDLKRDYYYNKQQESYETPLDDMLGIRAYERVGAGVCAKLLTLATDVSYAKSVEYATAGEVSRQTVHNTIKKVPHLEKMPVKEHKKVEAIHIYVDEDHVHMQRPNKAKGKENAIVPLVTVTEGIEQKSRTRRATINPMRFTDEKLSTKALWERVSGYLLKAYDMGACPKVYIYGDGGTWIQGGMREIPNAVYVMDDYHFEKALKTVARSFPNSNCRRRIHQVIQNKDEQKARSIADEMIRASADEKTKESAVKFKKYLLNNWEAILNMYLPDVTGSCTEGQVSHSLAKRFSRNPLGWGKDCLGKLANTRLYKLNGGEITSEQIKCWTEQEESYRQYVKEYLQQYIGQSFDWSIFEGQQVTFVNGDVQKFMNDLNGSGYLN